MTDTAALIVESVFVFVVIVVVAWVFVWAAKRDGEDDKALQKRLGIKRKTRLGR